MAVTVEQYLEGLFERSAQKHRGKPQMADDWVKRVSEISNLDEANDFERGTIDADPWLMANGQDRSQTDEEYAEFRKELDRLTEENGGIAPYQDEPL